MATVAETQWTDRSYPVPAVATYASGTQEWARNVFDRIARWGHRVTEEAYIEEEGRAYGRWTDESRALRYECTLDGRHRVVIRYDRETVSPDAWSVTVDGRPQELPSLAGQMWWWKLAVIALAAHRATP
ncbi:MULTISPECIES: hypothetical protein [unclassified Streptomyces]|uniref:hypothetical protein n=1 Tax=unclassified Streptomyces TaxID=2593676 RepID=UPI0035D68475